MSEIFKIQKNSNYTAMSNIHLQDRKLSLKAKGLLSLMLSLPAEKWKYSIKGLSSICRDGVDSVREGIRELERAGYIRRSRERKESGKLGAAVYLIYEEPQTIVPGPASPVLDEPMQEKPALGKPILENPTQVNPTQENPAQENPALDNPIQSNTNRPNTKEEKEKEKTTHSSMINPSSINRSIREPDASAVTLPAGLPGVRRRLSGKELTEWVKDQIDYEDLCMDHNRDTIDNIVSLITEVISTQCDHFTMSGKQVPAELVYERFRKISYMDIEYIFECLDKSCSKIRNIKQYWFTALFNAPASRSNYYDAEVRHDFCFG